jgi:hypothetical protein
MRASAILAQDLFSGAVSRRSITMRATDAASSRKRASPRTSAASAAAPAKLMKIMADTLGVFRTCSESRARSVTAPGESPVWQRMVIRLAGISSLCLREGGAMAWIRSQRASALSHLPSCISTFSREWAAMVRAIRSPERSAAERSCSASHRASFTLPSSRRLSVIPLLVQISASSSPSVRAISRARRVRSSRIREAYRSANHVTVAQDRRARISSRASSVRRAAAMILSSRGSSKVRRGPYMERSVSACIRRYASWRDSWSTMRSARSRQGIKAGSAGMLPWVSTSTARSAFPVLS